MERTSTLLDFDVLMDRVLADYEKEQEELNSGGTDSALIKSLRRTRNLLNRLELG